MDTSNYIVFIMLLSFWTNVPSTVHLDQCAIWVGFTLVSMSAKTETTPQSQIVSQEILISVSYYESRNKLAFVVSPANTLASDTF